MPSAEAEVSESAPEQRAQHRFDVKVRKSLILNVLVR